MQYKSSIRNNECSIKALFGITNIILCSRLFGITNLALFRNREPYALIKNSEPYALFGIINLIIRNDEPYLMLISE